MRNRADISLILVCAFLLAGCESESASKDCTPHAYTQCIEEAAYWMNSCGEQGSLAEVCRCGCNTDYTGCRNPCDCTPDCGARECGPVPNGCGDSCGLCSGTDVCDDATGQCSPCTPDCGARECGPVPNGCGDSCGLCSGTDVCDDATGQCSPCTPDCGARECGPVPNGCGDSCGLCSGTDVCDDATGQCSPCTPDCGTRECGPVPNGCGDSCGLCSGTDVCDDATGQCSPCTPDCGARECGPVPNGCGDSCGLCSGTDVCDDATGQCSPCTPDCGARECGPVPNGCGDSCGLCSGTDVCDDATGQCSPCTPDCGARECGPVPNGCGDSCGLCSGTDVCDDATGQCSPCTPDCGARECGPVPNGCGDSCGLCSGTDVCDDATGQCSPCTPDCGARECGPVPNGCGDSCGLCSGTDVCDDATGQCSPCTPDCGARECGPVPNGCGLSCGSCPDDNVCEDGTCIQQESAPVILDASANTYLLNETETLLITAIVTDPQGIADVIGGILKNASQTRGYGAFTTSSEEGSYQISLTWDDIDTVETIQAERAGRERVFTALFYDAAGHQVTTDISVTLQCSGGLAACDGDCLEHQEICDGSDRCIDIGSDPSNCGDCDFICPEVPDGDPICEAGSCDVDCHLGFASCGVADCREVLADVNNCGGCGVHCESNQRCLYGVCIDNDVSVTTIDSTTSIFIDRNQTKYFVIPMQEAARLEVNWEDSGYVCDCDYVLWRVSGYEWNRIYYVYNASNECTRWGYSGDLGPAVYIYKMGGCADPIDSVTFHLFPEGSSADAVPR